MSTNPEARLVAHSGAIKMSREEVAAIAAPPRTATHIPVAHIELITAIESSLAVHDVHIEKEEFAVQTDGMKIFGVFTLSQARGDYAFALGFRAANDKSLAISMVAGTRVFVCDNLALSGNLITLKRKHTSGLNLSGEVHLGVARAVKNFASVETHIDRMKNAELAEMEAKALIIDAVTADVISPRLVPAVVKNYFEPPHPEFAPRTKWSLHNAFTEAFKELRPNIAMESSIRLGELFGIQ